MGFSLIDVHAHLQDEQFAKDLPEVIARIGTEGPSVLINTGTDIPTSLEAARLAEKNPNFWGLAGVHPHDSKSWTESSAAQLEKILGHAKIVGLGEIGLDFHYDFSERNVQMRVFALQWELALRLEVPVVVHVRKAFDEFFGIVQEYGAPKKVMLHCFSGDMEIAKKALNLGFHFSVGGALTFRKSEETREVFKFLPVDRIHIETDCPYLAPEPFRGRRCEPHFIVHTFRRLCQERNCPPEILGPRLVQNARDFFSPKLKIEELP